jgi:hypothetical protein
MLARKLVTSASIVLIGTLVHGAAAIAQKTTDPPWNADHIDHLPVDIRNAVLAMCGERPNAGHYFATYSNNSKQINLHFEKFHCEGRPICTNAGCLHQTYALAKGHYRLVKSFYGPDSD